MFENEREREEERSMSLESPCHEILALSVDEEEGTRYKPEARPVDEASREDAPVMRVGKVTRGKREGRPAIIELSDTLLLDLLGRGSRMIWSLNVKDHCRLQAEEGRVEGGSSWE